MTLKIVVISKELTSTIIRVKWSTRLLKGASRHAGPTPVLLRTGCQRTPSNGCPLTAFPKLPRLAELRPVPGTLELGPMPSPVRLCTSLASVLPLPPRKAKERELPLHCGPPVG